ncbi:MAG: hypothetical protein WC729_29545 [Sphingomonas sp.]|uniref:hypothetical protein n=1 Tax=Sphingomonas sp. TaxID=28214 RepID=UPI00356A7C8D
MNLNNLIDAVFAPYFAQKYEQATKVDPVITEAQDWLIGNLKNEKADLAEKIERLQKELDLKRKACFVLRKACADGKSALYESRLCQLGPNMKVGDFLRKTMGDVEASLSDAVFDANNYFQLERFDLYEAVDSPKPQVIKTSWTEKGEKVIEHVADCDTIEVARTIAYRLNGGR